MAERVLIDNFRALNKTCLVIGGSGESGKAILKEVVNLRLFSRVILVLRRKLEYDNEQMQQFEQRLIDFDKMEKKDFEGADVAYCCLGTTRGTAGTEGFVKIEHDYVVNSAKLLHDAGCKHFHIVSSNGADEKSRLLYLRTKGQVEKELSEIGFERVSIYRPKYILVDRTEHRPLERYFLKPLLTPIACLFPTAMTTPIEVMARAMVMATVNNGPLGTEILENQRIFALGKEPFQK